MIIWQRCNFPTKKKSYIFRMKRPYNEIWQQRAKGSALDFRSAHSTLYLHNRLFVGIIMVQASCRRVCVCVCVFNDLPPSCEGLTRMSNAPISCFPPPSPYTHRRPTVRQRWIYTFPIPAPIFASFAGGRRVKGGIISVNPFYFHPSPPPPGPPPPSFLIID